VFPSSNSLLFPPTAAAIQLPLSRNPVYNVYNLRFSTSPRFVILAFAAFLAVLLRKKRAQNIVLNLLVGCLIICRRVLRPLRRRTRHDEPRRRSLPNTGKH
jgi:hypothetical protein